MIAQLLDIEIELITTEDSTKDITQTMHYGITMYTSAKEEGILGSALC
jgi:hypothetical protein